MPEREHEPVSPSEIARWMARHERDSDETHREMLMLIREHRAEVRSLEKRQDAINVRLTVIFAVVAVLWSIFVLIAPLLRDILGVPVSGG